MFCFVVAANIYLPMKSIFAMRDSEYLSRDLQGFYTGRLSLNLCKIYSRISLLMRNETQNWQKENTLFQVRRNANHPKQQNQKPCFMFRDKKGKGKGSLCKSACLEDSQTGLAKVIKCASFCILSGGKPSSEDLHSQQCENENEKDQQDQESVDGGYGVDKRLDKVSHTCPISITRKKSV